MNFKEYLNGHTVNEAKMTRYDVLVQLFRDELKNISKDDNKRLNDLFMKGDEESLKVAHDILLKYIK